MNTTKTPGLVRDNYKGHGRPQSFLYWGRGLAHLDQGTEVATVTAEGGFLRLTDPAGVLVDLVGVASKFWTSPVPEVASKATRTRRPNQPCRCGCGATANGRRGSLYLQGHDARHASAVAILVAAGDKAALDELPSDALKAKALHQAERLAAPVAA